eukprot:5097311-Alexandrium_andersonii.AAC.1
MQNGCRHSELELRGPGNDLKIGPWSSSGVRSARFCELSPMVATRSAPRWQEHRRRGAARHERL